MRFCYLPLLCWGRGSWCRASTHPYWRTFPHIRGLLVTWEQATAQGNAGMEVMLQQLKPVVGCMLPALLLDDHHWRPSLLTKEKRSLDIACPRSNRFFLQHCKDCMEGTYRKINSFWKMSRRNVRSETSPGAECHCPGQPFPGHCWQRSRPHHQSGFQQSQPEKNLASNRWDWSSYLNS